MVPPKPSPHHTDFFPVRRRGGSSGEAMSSFFSALPLPIAKELFQCFESKIHIFSVSAGSDPLSTWWRAVHWKSRCSNGCGTDWLLRQGFPPLPRLRSQIRSRSGGQHLGISTSLLSLCIVTGDIVTVCSSPKGSLTALLHSTGEERHHSSTLMAFNTEGRKDGPRRYFGQVCFDGCYKTESWVLVVPYR